MSDLNALPLPEVYRALAATGLVRRLLELAREEDLGAGPHAGDITSLVSVPADRAAQATIVARESGVICGLAALPEVVSLLAPDATLEVHWRDGDTTHAHNTPLALIRGPERQLLAFERTALNLLGRLSGVATNTARFVAAMGTGTRAHLYDTRKTTPGLRVLEKYAVRCGGGRSHRLALHDAVLIKDNHLAGVALGELAGVVERAARDARRLRPELAFFEVEVESLDQLDRLLALPAGVIDVILLDNMGPVQLRSAVARRERAGSRVELESSGGVRLDTVRQIAETGVERISAGALTHGATWLDVAMDMHA